MRAETNASSLVSIAEWVGLDGVVFERQYKDHLSDFHAWNQKDHADKWLLFVDNLGTHLSLDETSVSNGELYSVLTNKAAKGGKGSLVAMVEGTKTSDISAIFNKIPLVSREKVIEVTLDFSSSMENAARGAFPNARITTDRFHVQQLVSEALQAMRVSLRWKAIREENEAVGRAKKITNILHLSSTQTGTQKNNSLLEVATCFSNQRASGPFVKKNEPLCCFKNFQISTKLTNSR